MRVEEIKRRIAALSPAEQTEVTAFLSHLRRARDDYEYRQLAARLVDPERLERLTVEDFEQRSTASKPLESLPRYASPTSLLLRPI
jgi:hypothetical protein